VSKKPVRGLQDKSFILIWCWD